MIKRLVCALVLVATALLLCVSALAEDGFEGFDVIIIGQENIKEETETPTNGLALTIGKAEVLEEYGGEKDSDHVWIAVDAKVVNWLLEPVKLTENIHATLTYHDDYAFTGKPVFSLENLGVLEELAGQLVFKVPVIVALAKPEELLLTTVSAEREAIQQLDITQSAKKLTQAAGFPFEYEKKIGTAIEAAAVETAVFDSYRGRSEEVARWLEVKLRVINWSHEAVTLNDDTLKAQVVYANTYGFPGTIEYDQAKLEPLESAVATLVIRVPTLVTKAQSGQVELWLDAEGFEWTESMDMESAVCQGEKKAEEQARAEAAVRAKIRNFSSVGNASSYGAYPQTASGSDSTPINWIVLDVQDGKALLISRYGLDAKPYNNTVEPVTWEMCTLRAWLNNEFLNKAFSPEEQKAILTTTIDNSKGLDCNHTMDSKNTQDKIFLLSYAEVNTYRFFSHTVNGAENYHRRLAATDYAIQQWERVYDRSHSESNDDDWWWMRSSSSYNSAGCVGTEGNLDCWSRVDQTKLVRPAFWLNLNY